MEVERAGKSGPAINARLGSPRDAAMPETYGAVEWPLMQEQSDDGVVKDEHKVHAQTNDAVSPSIASITTESKRLAVDRGP